MLDVLLATTISMVTSYHIGNSLTQDGFGNKIGTMETGTFGVEALGRALGHDYRMGFHMTSATSLTGIWEQPTLITQTRGPYYTFSNALPNFHWDHVILEPYYEPFSQSIPTIDNFIQLTRSNETNSNSIFYVYQLWPHRKFGDLTYYWESSADTEVDSPMVNKRAYYSALMDRLRETYADTGIEVRLIPIGEVFHRVDLLIKAGELPGIVLDGGIYRDQSHCTLDLGRYLAAGTIVSTIFQHSLEGIPVPLQFQQRQYPQEVFEKLSRAIWEAVSSSPYTGILPDPPPPPPPLPGNADFDGNGWVDQSDLAIWQDSYALGTMNSTDFLNWQRSYNPPPVSEATAVPEPHAGIMALVTALMFSPAVRNRRFSRGMRQLDCP